MAKRQNNYSRIEDRSDYIKTDNEDYVLEYLEKNGKLPHNKCLKPSKINKKCLIYYNIIQDLNNMNRNKLIIYDVYKSKKELYQKYIINLVSIVISSVIKRFKTLYPLYYNEVYTECVLDILERINKNKYDINKSSQHSYCYETSYQACMKYLNEKAQYENKTVQLIQ